MNREDAIKNQYGLITVHSVLALERKEFSKIVANVPATIENEERLLKTFSNKDNWYFQYHTARYNMKWVVD